MVGVWIPYVLALHVAGEPGTQTPSFVGWGGNFLQVSLLPFGNQAVSSVSPTAVPPFLACAVQVFTKLLQQAR